MLRFRGVILAIMPYHSSTERQCSDFGADFGTFERICSVFQGHSMVIFMTEWVDSDVLNWVGILRFRQFDERDYSILRDEYRQICVPKLLWSD